MDTVRAISPTGGASVSKNESPIEMAMAQLKTNIAIIQETMTKFETILAAVITNPEKLPSDEPDTTASQTSLESRLNSMSDEVMGINRYLQDMQNRIQL